MEKYINRCIDSMLDSGCADKLEVIVVNDGSKDRTLEIARLYETKYSDTVIVVNKSNGHYGSCVNAALKIAKGKYFRIVDSDDWVDSNSLKKVVNIMENREEEVIFTRFTTQYLYKNKTEEQKVEGIEWDNSLDLNLFKFPEACLAMHSLTYKLDLLKRLNYVQTEGICYTDTEYVYYPLSQATNLYCINASLYQYYIGREDQTMSTKSLVRNLSHFRKLYDKLVSFKPVTPNDNFCSIKEHYISATVLYMLYVHLVYSGEFDSSKDCDLNKILQKIKTTDTYIYKKVVDVKYHKVPFVKNWINGGIAFMFQCLLFSVLRKTVL